MHGQPAPQGRVASSSLPVFKSFVSTGFLGAVVADCGVDSQCVGLGWQQMELWSSSLPESWWAESSWMERRNLAVLFKYLRQFFKIYLFVESPFICTMAV